MRTKRNLERLEELNNLPEYKDNLVVMNISDEHLLLLFIGDDIPEEFRIISDVWNKDKGEGTSTIVVLEEPETKEFLYAKLGIKYFYVDGKMNYSKRKITVGQYVHDYVKFHKLTRDDK